jgi:penicillin-binding protein 1A
VAAKTGTTNSNRDAWTIGYTPGVVVSVWAGNNDNHPMKKGGVAMAGPIWNRFMVEALKTVPNEGFERPNLYWDPSLVKPILRGHWQGNESFLIDTISEKLATENTPEETIEEKVITNVHSILYWVDPDDILGPPPQNPADDPQFLRWEAPVQNWWRQNSGSYSQTSANDRPNQEDDIHTDSSGPEVEILEPKESSTYLPEEKVFLEISSSGKFPLQKIDIFINDVYLGTSTPPFNFSFIPSELESLREKNELRIVAYDSAYNRGEAVITFHVE